MITVVEKARPKNGTERRKWARKFVAEVAWSAIMAGANADDLADTALYAAVLHEIHKLEIGAGLDELGWRREKR